MKITSNWNDRVFWRTFATGDTVYIVGHREGFVENGESFECNHPSGYFQMELKQDGLLGKTIIAAGRKFSNEDQFILTSDGQLLGIEDAIQVTMDDRFSFEDYGSSIQFFDWSGSSTDTQIEINSSLEQVTTSSGEKTTVAANTAKDTTGSEVEGKASVEEEYKSIKYGLELNAKALICS